MRASKTVGLRWAYYALSAVCIALSFRLTLPKHNSMLAMCLLFLAFDALSQYRLRHPHQAAGKSRNHPFWIWLNHFPLWALLAFCCANLVENFALWSPFWRTYAFGFVISLVTLKIFWGAMLAVEMSCGFLAQHLAPQTFWQRLFNNLQRGVWRLSLISIPLILLAFIIGSTRTVFRIDCRSYVIEDAELPEAFEGFTVVQFSDLHIGSQIGPDFLNRMVDSIQAYHPDLIVFTGDMINFTPEEIVPYQAILAKLNAPYGVMAIYGNHDYGTYLRRSKGVDAKQRHQSLQRIYETLGWTVLDNTHTVIRRDSAELYLAGVGFWGPGTRFSTTINTHQALQQIPNNAYTILLDHNPIHFEDSISRFFPQVDLCLSGHTHGAQMGLRYEKFKISPLSLNTAYWGGWYRYRNQNLIVNTGTGFNALPFRIGIKPELSIIRLSSGQKNH